MSGRRSKRIRKRERQRARYQQRMKTQAPLPSPPFKGVLLAVAQKPSLAAIFAAIQTSQV
jgi:hypothetical protein